MRELVTLTIDGKEVRVQPGVTVYWAAKAAAIVADEAMKEYPLRGEVLTLDPASKVARIKHEAIENGDDQWMGAMTMEFPVREDAEFAKLQEGEAIEATLHVQGLQFWIDDVRPATAASAPQGDPAAGDSAPVPGPQ